MKNKLCYEPIKLPFWQRIFKKKPKIVKKTQEERVDEYLKNLSFQPGRMIRVKDRNEK